MKNGLLQRIVLVLAAVVFCGFLAAYVLGMSSAVIACGTFAPVLVLFAMYLGLDDDDEKEIPKDAIDEEEESHDRPHVDNLIDQLVERREIIEERDKSLSEAEDKIETLSQRLLALESENMELSDELAKLKDERGSLNQELSEAKDRLIAQEERVKDSTISILPIAEGEEPKIVDISEVAEKCKQELFEATEKAGIRIIIAKPAKPLLVKADPRMLDVLFKNIIDNSIKYMITSGTLQITVSDIGEDLFIVCKDNGEGLAPDETEHIFELNYQGSNRISGNGLGLAQARAIVEYYGGMIYARSSTGNGMGIYIHLPAAG